MSMDREIEVASDEEVEGQIQVPGGRSSGQVGKGGFVDVSTLDEPVKETFLRDFRAVGERCKAVFKRGDKKALLNNWDLWGPLFFFFVMAWFVDGEVEYVSGKRHGAPEFTELFALIWVGALVVTANSHMLGGTLSYFQSVCVLGYCVLPLILSLFLCWIVLFFHQNIFWFILRFIFTSGGFFFAVSGALNFMGDSNPKNKRALAVYPIFLFYFVIAWLVISAKG